MEKLNIILITVVMIVFVITILHHSSYNPQYYNSNNEGFHGYTEPIPDHDLYGSYGAPARPDTEYLDTGYLKHAIISPRNKITLLSPTPPIKKTNCFQIKCPESLCPYGLKCWRCNGFEWTY